MKINLLIVSFLMITFAYGSASAQTDNCWFTPTEDTTLYAAPVFDMTQQSGMVVPDESYEVLQQAPEYLYIERSDGRRGFVERDRGILSGTCGMNVPTVSAPLHTYPTLCVLTTPEEAIPLYIEAARRTQKDTLLPNANYAVIRQIGASYYVYIDRYDGGWISEDIGSLDGQCSDLPGQMPSVAVTLENARVWSTPDVHNGVLLATLTPNSQVTVLDGPTSGPVLFTSTDIQGDWYQVSQGDVIGWVWSERLMLAALVPASGWAAALDETRAWSHPDVRVGVVQSNISAGTRLRLTAGPVSGPIRYDTDANGDWYQVSDQEGTVLGWVWAGRLELE